MTKIHCLNQISREGLKLLTDDYKITENLADADAVLVRSANMHEMELPDGLEAIARAGAGAPTAKKPACPIDTCPVSPEIRFSPTDVMT